MREVPIKREKGWQVAPHLSPEALATFMGMWPGPALELVGLWFHFLLFVLKFSLEQISLWPLSLATNSPHRTFVQRMRKNHFVKVLSCHLLCSCHIIQIHKAKTTTTTTELERTVKGSLLPQVDTSKSPLSHERTGSPPQTQDLLGLDLGCPSPQRHEKSSSTVT